MARVILAALLAAATLFLGLPVDAVGQTPPPAGDRWSGKWDIEEDSNEDGIFEHVGVLKLELVTDGSMNLYEPDWPCQESDRDYRGTYQYGGGGTIIGCESSEFDYKLSLEYYQNDGSWGQADMNYKGGSPAKWEGNYSPATFNPRGEFAYLLWRGTKVETQSCAAPQYSGSRSAAEPDCNDPVIFLPGFLGSTIKCPGHGGEVWPNDPKPEMDNMRLNAQRQRQLRRQQVQQERGAWRDDRIRLRIRCLWRLQEVPEIDRRSEELLLRLRLA
jgi:hypothetical protein